MGEGGVEVGVVDEEVEGERLGGGQSCRAGGYGREGLVFGRFKGECVLGSDAEIHDE